jgi:hypothetical protein
VAARGKNSNIMSSIEKKKGKGVEIAEKGLRVVVDGLDGEGLRLYTQ